MRHERITPTDHVHPAYSVQRFRRAYAHNIMPCRDKSEWAEVSNCPKVAPPHYEKKVGRPKKNRRKKLEEKQSKRGGTVMSKHGVVIHYSHCGNPGHNKGGCEWAKSGMPPKKQMRKKHEAVPDDLEEDDVLVITHDNVARGGISLSMTSTKGIQLLRMLQILCWRKWCSRYHLQRKGICIQGLCQILASLLQSSVEMFLLVDLLLVCSKIFLSRLKQ